MTLFRVFMISVYSLSANYPLKYAELSRGNFTHVTHHRNKLSECMKIFVLKSSCFVFRPRNAYGKLKRSNIALLREQYDNSANCNISTSFIFVFSCSSSHVKSFPT